MSENYLSKLSPQQRNAAQDIEGASLIIAGAGSGKTRTLTYRIAHLIDSGVMPHNILALTFTNKAAREMRTRIAQVMPYERLRGLWMGTFHGVFRRILSAEASVLGYPENFTIYETADSRNLIKSIIKEMQLPEDRYKPADVLSRISLAKNSLTTPPAYEANQGARTEDEAAKRPEIYKIYARYVQRCKANGAMDFDDILLQMNYLIRDFPEVAAKYSEMFRYIMVDEYQDTNYSQYLIVKKLAAAHGNICVVGDDSQSIYSFRGARIDNILRFEKDFVGAKVFKLEQNYRSTRTIVEASNSLIDHNEGKLQKELYSENEKGDLIRVIECYTDKDEAARVASDIFSTIYNSGAEPSDFAILYRTNAQSRAFEEQLRNKNIPYKIYGGHSFYQRAEIKDMLAYLRLAVNPNDNEALKRIINVPARGIGATSMSRIEGAALASGRSMFDILRSVNPSEIGVRGVAVKGITSFIEAFSSFGDKVESADAYDFASEVAQRSGLLSFYRSSTAVEDKTRLENIEELLSSIKNFNPQQQEIGITVAAEGEVVDMDEEAEDKVMTIAEYLSEVALLSDQDTDEVEDEAKVTLLTVHSSKGLEFKYVYIVGMEEKLFPSIRLESSESEIEEERRLFYVAMTRAEKRVTLSYALTRFKWGDVVDSLPSRFLKDIDENYLDMEMSGSSGGGVSRRDVAATGGSGSGFGGGASRYGSARGGSGFGAKGGGGYGAKPRFGANGSGGATGYRSARSGQSSDSDFVQSAVKSSGGGYGSGGALGSSSGGMLRKVGDSRRAAVAQSAPSAAVSGSSIVVGSRVSHHKFGEGVVVSVEQSGSDLKLGVEFRNFGVKTLLQKFAKLQVLG